MLLKVIDLIIKCISAVYFLLQLQMIFYVKAEFECCLTDFQFWLTDL